MRSRRNNVAPDTYVVKTMERDVPVSGSILETVEAIGKRFGWEPSNYKELSHGMYHGKLKNNSVYAFLDERRWYSKKEVENWRTALTEALDELSLTEDQSLQSNFQKFTLDKKILPIPQEFISLLQGGDAYWQELEYIESRLQELYQDLIKDTSVPIHGTETIVFKGLKYHPNKYYELTKGYRRKAFAGKTYSVQESTVKTFINLLTQGDIEVVKPMLYVNFENPNPDKFSSSPIKTYADDELEVIDYPGGQAYIFPML